MASGSASDLRLVAATLRAGVPENDGPIQKAITALADSASQVGNAWSGSALGYHAHVYYAGLQMPPAGALFDSQWGFRDAFSTSTRGDWNEFRPDDVVEEIYRRAAVEDRNLRAARDAARAAEEQVRAARDEIDSIIEIELSGADDSRLRRLQDEAAEIGVPDLREVQRALMPSGSVMSHDHAAIGQGFRLAPHLQVLADVGHLRIAFNRATELARIAEAAAAHVDRVALPKAGPVRAEQQGAAVFIGHGRSALWRELKDFVHDRLGLEWEEFNRVPVAGRATTDRLAEMLDGSGIAFIILSAEDEQLDGTLRARQNVVHEAGLFQGRLGFHRAIILLEEGCEEFSNIFGLTQIRFASGDIASRFEDVRAVLEREDFLPGAV
jgi:predicted nucleotide-binding protein